MTNEKRNQDAESGTSHQVLPEDRFRSIFQLANDIIVYVDTRGRILDVNGQVRNVLGYAPEEVKGKDFTKFGFVSPKDTPRMLKPFWDAVRKGKVEETSGKGWNVLKLELKHKDGSRIQAEASTAEVRSNGRLTGFVSVIRDLSGLKRADRKWLESEERYKELFDDMPSGVAVYQAKDGGKDFIFEDFNRAGERIEGVRREELIGKTISQVFPNLEEFTLLETFRKVSRTGKPASQVRTEVLKDGKAVGWRENRIHRLPNGDIVSIFDDVTERQLAIQALGDLKRSYEDLFNNSPIGIYRTTPDGRILMVNSTLVRMLGHSSAAELAKRNLEQEGFEPSYPRSQFKEIMDSKGEVAGLEAAWMTKAGAVIFVRENAKAIRDEKENILCYEGTVENITQRKQAAESLRQSEERHRTLFEGSLHPITIYDRDANIVMLNKVGAENLKRPLHEIIGKPLKEFIPDTHELTAKRVRQVLDTGKPLSVEDEISLPGGRRWFLSTLHPVADPQGQPHLVQVISYDITQRKQAEEALRQSEEKFSKAFHATSNLMGISTVKEGRIIDVNEGYSRLAGYKRDELIGRTTGELNIWADQEQRKAVVQKLQTDGRVRDFEVGIRSKSGDVRTVLFSADTITLNDQPCLINMAIDITERKRAEEALRLSEDRLKKAQAIAHIGSWDWNIKEGTLFWSEELYRIFGVDRRTFKLSHESIESLIHPEDIESNNRQVKRLLEEADSGEYSFRAVRPDGEIRHLNQIFEVVRDCKGTAVRAFGTIQDVTERERLLQRLIQSEKAAAVGTLSYGIAHEFNNILAGIMANAEYGLGTDDVNQTKECFRIIVENSQRGSSITNSLLAVAGEKKRKREPANVRQALENVLSFSQRELEKAGIRVIQNLQDVPETFCDLGEFSEVFLNMINNARDAMTPKGGTLTVKIDHARDNIRIAFEDTGYGISEEIKDRIFDAFVTTKGALGSSKVPGTGLGLFVSRGIVDSYGGTIEVSSRPGKGARFTVIVPVTSNLSSERASREETRAPREPLTKLNILVIDDEPTICRVLKKFLESKGHLVTASRAGGEALECFEKGGFDIVLSDITMPGMDGIELIRRIKEKDKSAKVIAITGHVRQETLDRTRKAGAQDILIKPFRSGELYESILRLHQDTG